MSGSKVPGDCGGGRVGCYSEGDATYTDLQGVRLDAAHKVRAGCLHLLQQHRERVLHRHKVFS